MVAKDKDEEEEEEEPVWINIFEKEIYHPANRLRSFLSLGHSVNRSIGHSVTQSLTIFNIDMDGRTD